MKITIENDNGRSGKTNTAFKIAQMLQPEHHNIWYYSKGCLPYLPSFIKHTPIIIDNLDVSLDIIIFDEVFEDQLMSNCKTAIIVKG